MEREITRDFDGAVSRSLVGTSYANAGAAKTNVTTRHLFQSSQSQAPMTKAHGVREKLQLAHAEMRLHREGDALTHSLTEGAMLMSL